MARIIKSTIVPHLKCNVNTIFENGDVSTVSYEKGDTVENLRYIENEEVKTISGIITDIKLYTVKKQKVSFYATNTFSEDVIIESLVIDASKEYNANIVTVPAKEIVEDAGVVDVKRMQIIATLSVGIEMEYTDGTIDKEELVPGNMINDIVVMGTDKEIAGDFMLFAFGYTVKNSVITISSIILRNHTRVLTALIDRIIKVGDCVTVTTDMAVVQDIINGPSSICVMDAMNYESAVSVNKKFTLIGPNYGIAANSGSRATNDAIDGEAVLSGAIEFLANADIELDGLTFTNNAKVLINGSANVAIKNCRFVNMNADQSKTFLIRGTETETPVLLQIENCYFGNQDVNSAGKMHNLFEMNAVLKDGSYYKNCHFADKICKNNIINLYNVEDGATIEISGNVFEYSGNAVRVGMKKEPHCVINILNNTYYTSSIYPEYAGLMIVEPYVKETTSFANCIINIAGTKKCEGQLFYFYTDSGTLQLTEENKPTIYVDGVLQEV